MHPVGIIVFEGVGIQADDFAHQLILHAHVIGQQLCHDATQGLAALGIPVLLAERIHFDALRLGKCGGAQNRAAQQ